VITDFNTKTTFFFLAPGTEEQAVKAEAASPPERRPGLWGNGCRKTEGDQLTFICSRLPCMKGDENERRKA
jgi:hypothetical protein